MHVWTRVKPGRAVTHVYLSLPHVSDSVCRLNVKMSHWMIAIYCNLFVNGNLIIQFQLPEALKMIKHQVLSLNGFRRRNL